MDKLNRMKENADPAEQAEINELLDQLRQVEFLDVEWEAEVRTPRKS